MATRRKVRNPGAREVVVGGMLWTFLLVVLLAVISFPELGGWPNWLWTR